MGGRRWFEVCLSMGGSRRWLGMMGGCRSRRKPCGITKFFSVHFFGLVAMFVGYYK